MSRDGRRKSPTSRARRSSPVLVHYAAFVAAEESETVIQVGLALARRMWTLSVLLSLCNDLEDAVHLSGDVHCLLEARFSLSTYLGEFKLPLSFFFFILLFYRMSIKEKANQQNSLTNKKLATYLKLPQFVYTSTSIRQTKADPNSSFVNFL